MKRLVLFSFLASLVFFTACQNESPITGPQNSEIQKSKTAEPNWIGLPQAANKSLAKKFITSEFITVAEGGYLLIDQSYISAEGKHVKAYSKIEFAPGVVKEDHVISMEINDVNGVAEFLPHQMFNDFAILNQTFEGLNLTGIDPSTIELYYMATDGTYEVMTYDQLIINVETGTVQVVNGRIPHFSIYGFGV